MGGGSRPTRRGGDQRAGVQAARRRRRGSDLLDQRRAGGVGAVAVQMAVARGALVVGTASERNHDFLRSLGAEPTTYGPGLVEP
jgi:NADPH:quinone reductase-like Zn-dependent oxidoreductase